jgi:steroid delta-isomerase-like uncharacterized protein
MEMESKTMGAQEQMALVQRILEEAFNHGHLDVVDEGFAPDAVIHDPGLEYRGTAELRRGLDRLRTAFPDFHFTVEDLFAGGDKIAVRYRGEGTHRGVFLGIPATGRRISYTGILIVRLQDGLIAEFWAQPDLIGILRQLGAFSADGQAASLNYGEET